MSIHQDEREKRFWNNYLATLHQFDIKPSLRRWYVQRCEQFLRHDKSVRLKQHTSTTVTAYLTQLLDNATLEAWQQAQAIHAVQLLFKTINAPLYHQIDWDYWKASTREHSKNHDTHYRQHRPIERIDHSIVSDAGEKTAIRQQLDQVRLAIRRLNYSIRTERSYVDWVERFLRFHREVPFETLDDSHIVAFIEYLAVTREVAPATQSAALNAIVFYYKQVRRAEMGDFSHFIRAKRREKLPVVLTQSETVQFLSEVSGLYYLICALLYGCGLRIMEAVRLRVAVTRAAGYQWLVA